jgi:hypothetical protein
MLNTYRQPEGFPRRRGNFALAGCLRWLLPLLFFVVFSGAATADSEIQRASTNSVGPALQYTVADFDGDLRPDLVGVQTGTAGFSGTQYWIELQLSAAGRQSIPVFARSGGIQVAARDVNGDHSLDLVLTTTWFSQPVAIFLNDGHGSFTRVDPGAFPNAFRGATTELSSRRTIGHDCAGVPPSSPTGAVLAEFSATIVDSQIDKIAQANRRFGINQFLTSQLGRAPPASLLYH